MEEKIFLGKTLKEFKEFGGENVYLEKHSFDCGWYWGFGYVGNARFHAHFDGMFLKGGETDINKVFEETPFNQGDWWLLRDLFIQAYALKECAEVYRHGGHQTTKEGITDIIQSKKMETQINKDLEIVLNKIWEIVTAKTEKVEFKQTITNKIKEKFYVIVKPIDERPLKHQYGKMEGNHFKITLKNKETQKSGVFYYTTGTGIKDISKTALIRGLFSSLISDLPYIDRAEYEGLGYEPSLETEKRYKNICEEVKKFEELGLKDLFESLTDKEKSQLE